jgi:hypothetical protein
VLNNHRYLHVVFSVHVCVQEEPSATSLPEAFQSSSRRTQVRYLPHQHVLHSRSSTLQRYCARFFHAYNVGRASQRTRRRGKGVSKEERARLRREREELLERLCAQPPPRGQGLCMCVVVLLELKMDGWPWCLGCVRGRIHDVRCQILLGLKCMG